MSCLEPNCQYPHCQDDSRSKIDTQILPSIHPYTVVMTKGGRFALKNERRIIKYLKALSEAGAVREGAIYLSL